MKFFGLLKSEGYVSCLFADDRAYNVSLKAMYPKNDKIIENTNITFDSGDGTRVRVFFVDVVHIEESLEQLKCML